MICFSIFLYYIFVLFYGEGYKGLTHPQDGLNPPNPRYAPACNLKQISALCSLSLSVCLKLKHIVATWLGDIAKASTDTV